MFVARSIFVASFLVLAGVGHTTETIVTEEELKAVAELVDLQKSRYQAGVVDMLDVFDAERLHLRAQYWAGKITKAGFVEKANVLNGEVIKHLKKLAAAGNVNKGSLLKAYENLFDDRRIQ